MPQDKVICPKCNTAMVVGFVPDYSRGTVQAEYWIEGKFATRWLGLRPRSRKPALAITTYRCPTCGFQEAYAE
jgi:RNase P subunit RPR2